MTGGPKAYLPGVLCVIHRLSSVGSVHPLVVMVPEEEVAWFTRELDRHGPLHPRLSILATSHLEYSFGTSAGRRATWADTFAKRWRDKGFHVLDKLHTLVAPFSRVVWLDADVHVVRNVDELCSLDDSVGFAAAYNVGAEARTCFHAAGNYMASERCTECQHHHISQQEQRSTYFTSRAIREDRRHLPNCTYEFNTGVMVVKPLSRRIFRKDVLEPLMCGQVSSSDKADQGAINHLVHARRLFGSRGVALLNNSYNVGAAAFEPANPMLRVNR